MDKLRLAIVGGGFVGSAVKYGFTNSKTNIFVVDPKLGTTIEQLQTFKPEYTFVCVPTPMGEDGKIDASILREVVTYLVDNLFTKIIIKSTVTPDIIDELFGLNPFRIVYNPEFLTEKSANEDFVNPIMHVFGGDGHETFEIEDLYKHYSNCKPCPTHHMSPTDASFVKYGMNCFLASKVLWFNQFADIVNEFGGNYNTVISAITTDQRIGTSHTTVPGYDGKRGFSGSCFPKDSFAFAKFANPDFTVLKEVIRRNNEYRTSTELSDREKEQHIRFDLDV